MAVTGRYDFPGIKRTLGLLIDGVLAGTVWGAWILASPFRPVIDYLRDLIINYLANRGIIILNIGANIVAGQLDQKAFDQAIEDGLQRVMQGRDRITPEEGKAIDDKVRAAFDDDADLGTDSGVQ